MEKFTIEGSIPLKKAFVEEIGITMGSDVSVNYTHLAIQHPKTLGLACGNNGKYQNNFVLPEQWNEALNFAKEGIFEKDEYYHISDGSWFILIKATGEYDKGDKQHPYYTYAISGTCLLRNNWYNAYPESRTTRFATPEEIVYLDQCISSNKYLTKEDALLIKKLQDGTKIWLGNNPDINKEVQERLFELGFVWAVDGITNPLYVDESNQGIYINENNKLTHTSSFINFAGNLRNEITAKDLGIEPYRVGQWVIVDNYHPDCNGKALKITKIYEANHDGQLYCNFEPSESSEDNFSINRIKRYATSDEINEAKPNLSFETSKWYTHENGAVCCYQGNNKGYGFSTYKQQWTSEDKLGMNKPEEWKLSTREEVGDMFIVEAEKRYFNESKIACFPGTYNWEPRPNEVCKVICSLNVNFYHSAEYYFSMEDNTFIVWGGGLGCIYKEGEWAKVKIEEEILYFGKIECIIHKEENYIETTHGNITKDEVDKAIYYIENPPKFFDYELTIYRYDYDDNALEYKSLKKSMIGFGCEQGTYEEMKAIQKALS